MMKLTLRLFKPNCTPPIFESTIALPGNEAERVKDWLGMELPFMLEAAICLHDDVQVSLTPTDAASVKIDTPEAKVEEGQGA